MIFFDFSKMKILFTFLSLSVLCTPQNTDIAFKQAGIKDKTKIVNGNVGTNVKQTLSGVQRGNKNKGHIVSNNSIENEGELTIAGNLNAAGTNNKGEIAVKNVIGVGASDNTLLSSDTTGKKNTSTLKAASVGGDYSSSVHSFVNSVGTSNKSVNISDQLGGTGSAQIANFVTNVKGGSATNIANQGNCANGTCAATSIASMEGNGGLLVNSFNNGGQGTINSLVANKKARGSTVLNLIGNSTQSDLSSDVNGNSVLNIGLTFKGR